MKISKIALVGGIASCTWLAMAIWRWWFQYPDLSNLVFAVVLGIISLGCFYVYNWMRHIDTEFQKARDFFNSRYDVLYDEIQELGKK